MVSVIASSFALMPQLDASTLGAHQNDFARFCNQSGFDEMMNDEDWCNGAGSVPGEGVIS